MISPVASSPVALLFPLVTVFVVWAWRINYSSRAARATILTVSEHAKSLIWEAHELGRWEELYEWYRIKNEYANRYAILMFWRPMSQFYPIAELDALYLKIASEAKVVKPIAEATHA